MHLRSSITSTILVVQFTHGPERLSYSCGWPSLAGEDQDSGILVNVAPMRDCEFEVAQRLVLCCRELYRVRGRWPLPGKHGCHNRIRKTPTMVHLMMSNAIGLILFSSVLYVSMCDVYR